MRDVTLRQFARGEPTDPGGDELILEVLRCYKRSVLPRAGGYMEQDWDFIYWTDRLDQYVTEHQALMAKANQTQ